jgi:hypothetical protein
MSLALIAAWVLSIGVMHDLAPCKGVIGVAFDKKGRVGHVFSNTPAAGAGFQVGDVLQDKTELKGKPGTKALVHWTSADGAEVAIIERICKDELGVDYWLVSK